MSLNPVRNMEAMSQPVLSEGLVFGKCGMTDIDLSCDWQGRTFVFVELKYGNTPLTRGQQYHLEGLVNAINAGGKKAVAIFASHDTPKGEGIEARNATVKRIYQGRKFGWSEAKDLDLLETMTILHSEHIARGK